MNAIPGGPIICRPRSSTIQSCSTTFRRRGAHLNFKETIMKTFDFDGASRFFAARLAFTTDPFGVNGMIERGEDIIIVDVRQPSDYRAGHIPGAVNLPNGKWHTAAGLSKDKLNVLYCYSQTCHLAAAAALELARQGYPVAEMEGGFDTWQAKAMPVTAVVRTAA
jgi:rhodanese-related sulfurtransferase